MFKFPVILFFIADTSPSEKELAVAEQLRGHVRFRLASAVLNTGSREECDAVACVAPVTIPEAYADKPRADQGAQVAQQPQEPASAPAQAPQTAQTAQQAPAAPVGNADKPAAPATPAATAAALAAAPAPAADVKLADPQKAAAATGWTANKG